MILTEYNEKLHEKTLREEGREEGRREERERSCQQMTEAVRSLMEKLDLSAEEAMGLLGLSEKDRAQYRDLL